MGNSKIRLIVKEETINSPTGDRGGGEMHSLPGKIIDKVIDKVVDIDKVKSSLETCINQVNTLLQDIKLKIVENWELNEITISLSISGEGSVGFATAGVEAGIEVTISPKK